MAVSFYPSPAVFASSYPRIERMSLETGEAVVIDDGACGMTSENLKPFTHHGMAISGQFLFATGQHIVMKFHVADADKYLEYPKHEKISGLPEDSNWMDVVSLPSNASQLFLLDRRNDIIFTDIDQIMMVKVNQSYYISTGSEHSYEAAHGMNWLDDHSNTTQTLWLLQSLEIMR
eukprot:scaffold84758_cov61-Attheya_sp.AAC.3